ncbi:MAG TPA: hypothetical protein VKE93_13550 [Candidatus Angelobacter sp.]|nr:hypothetical protein [Candidatus Angelobacter sp.]
MEREKNRVLLVYKSLGRVLTCPHDYGLGLRAPQPLVDALTAMRQSLRAELVEVQDFGDDDWLSDELAQDADGPARMSGEK